MTQENIKYSEMYKLQSGEDLHFCPACKYHIVDTNPKGYGNTYCPACGQYIKIRRPRLCKNICAGEYTNKEGKFYCSIYTEYLDSDINGDAIALSQCDW